MQSQVPSTTTALLERLQEPGNEAIWRELDGRYRPIIFAFTRKLGLDEADAADVAQDTMVGFVQAFRAGKYDPQRGRLRSWIIGIVKHRVADLHRLRAKRRAWRGESVLLCLPDDGELTQLWEAQRGRSLLGQAIAELREQTRLNEKTIRAFEMYVIDQLPGKEVARKLGITPNDVYVARRNVAARLREILARLEGIFDDG